MPIARLHDGRLLLFAHVPKCAGSAVESYLATRFGPLAFVDTAHLSQPVGRRWSATSPQHADMVSLRRLFPAGFLDLSFAVVRHPVARLVSAYHFQRGVEESVPEGVNFSEWLLDLPERLAETPFALDNHIKPMVEMVPENAAIFHLEHGIDAIVPWLDDVTGRRDGPRAMRQVNERHGTGPKPVPSARDRTLIAKIYAADFARFGYDSDGTAPAAPAPLLSEETLRERDAELRRDNAPAAKLRQVAGRVAGRYLRR